MIAAFLIVLREGFEATLLIAIILAYIARVGTQKDRLGVWYGVAAAAALSIATGGVMFATASGLQGNAAYIFKGGAMWLAVGVLTYMILWMRRQSRNLAQDIRHRVDEAVKKGSTLAMAVLAFVVVFREGLETALFMFGITQASSPAQVAIGSAAGLLGAVGLGYMVYAGGKRLNLGAFFKVTGVLLLVVAAGLLAHGTAMLQTAGLIPAFLYPLWDLSHISLLTHKNLLGQVLIAFFGWDPKPDLLEVSLWAGYLLTMGYTFLRPQVAPAPRPAEAR